MLFRYSLPVIAVLILILSWTAVLNKGRDTSYEHKREMIVMRQIGHVLLRQSGDSSSRVLPVQQVSASEYRLAFETSFSFTPDSLVALVKEEVDKAGLPGEYLVNMLDCNAKQVLYGFAITGTRSKDVVPCRGREQIKACYILQLSFPSQPSNAWMYLLGITGLGSIAVYLAWKRPKRTMPSVETVAEEPTEVAVTEEKATKTGIHIGRFAFDPVKQVLSIETETVPLTAKEAKVLGILSSSVNEVVDRSLLLKQVWEDEGVITGRSLDMFISKLRKKLQADEQVAIINIHGKGYKLCVTEKEAV